MLATMGIDSWVDRGTFSPTFSSGGDALCFSPLLFRGNARAQLHSTDYIDIRRSFRLLVEQLLIPTHLLLMKIIKIVATRYQILRLKCTKLYFGWGSSPDCTGGAYSTPPDSVAGFKGPTSERRGKEGGEGSPLLLCRSVPMGDSE